MRLRRKRSALEQLRSELNARFTGVARYEQRQHFEADHALSLAFATMRGADLEHIRAIVTDPRMTDATMVAKIREYMDGVW